MQEIILILLTIHCLGLILVGPKRWKSNTLCCGLLGYSGNIPWDINAIKLLFMYNETRGQDSCGFYDSKGIYKAETKASSKIVNGNNLKPSNFLIGHTRKSTFHGSINLKNAHPFEFENLIGAHNGSINNHRLLANNRKLNMHAFEIDTHAFYMAMNSDLQGNKAGYVKTLEEYEGQAALLFTLKDGNLYCYKDKDKPLFRGKINNKTGEGIYISSLKEGLEAIGCTKVKEFKDNVLYVLREGKLIHTTVIDRLKTKPTWIWDKEEWRKRQPAHSAIPINDRRWAGYAETDYPDLDETKEESNKVMPFVDGDYVKPIKAVADGSAYLADVIKAKVLAVDPETATMTIVIIERADTTCSVEIGEKLRGMRCEYFEIFEQPEVADDEDKDTPIMTPNPDVTNFQPQTAAATENNCDLTCAYQEEREEKFAKAAKEAEEDKAALVVSCADFSTLTEQQMAIFTTIRDMVRDVEAKDRIEGIDLTAIRTKIEEEIFLLAAITT